jgi:hypothetical protein
MMNTDPNYISPADAAWMAQTAAALSSNGSGSTDSSQQGSTAVQSPGAKSTPSSLGDSILSWINGGGPLFSWSLSVTLGPLSIDLGDGTGIQDVALSIPPQLGVSANFTLFPPSSAQSEYAVQIGSFNNWAYGWTGFQQSDGSMTDRFTFSVGLAWPEYPAGATISLNHPVSNDYWEFLSNPFVQAIY